MKGGKHNGGTNTGIAESLLLVEIVIQTIKEMQKQENTREKC